MFRKIIIIVWILALIFAAFLVFGCARQDPSIIAPGTMVAHTTIYPYDRQEESQVFQCEIS